MYAKFKDYTTGEDIFINPLTVTSVESNKIGGVRIDTIGPKAYIVHGVSAVAVVSSLEDELNNAFS